MGILSHLFCIDINRGVRNYQATPGAVLLDVRSGNRTRASESRKAETFPWRSSPGPKRFCPICRSPSLFTLMGERPVPGPSPG